MPYIRMEDRERLTPPEGMIPDIPKTAGELNYVISARIKREYTEKGKSYALFNDIIAALESAKLGLENSELAMEFSELVARYVFQTAGLESMEINKMSRRVNSGIGALEAAKLEFYRRVVAPYEDKKIFDNGDVY